LDGEELAKKVEKGMKVEGDVLGVSLGFRCGIKQRDRIS
jgi:hypothetical protein